MEFLDIVKIVSFTLTFYFLIDYIYTCSISTKNLGVIMSVIFVVIIVFYSIFVVKKYKRCPTCNQRHMIK